MSFMDKLAHSWNAFKNKDPSMRSTFDADMGLATTLRPDRTLMTRGNEKSMVTALYNRIAVDISRMDIKHIKLDDNDRYSEDCNSTLNYCLTTEANIDQTAQAFIHDIVLSLFDEGCIAIVPTDTDIDPLYQNAFDIKSLRVGRIVQWYPKHVKVRLYNENTGYKEELNFPKKMVAIVENPFYVIMNEPNSIVQRLVRKLNLLDLIDEQSGSGKLDLIIQLPYVIKTEARRRQAEQRRKDIEMQLSTSKYGIAYTDGTEKVVQLNRSLENNLMSQIEYLTDLMFAHLGIDKSILNGTADDQTLLNYQNNILEPVISAICAEMKRKFLTKTARTQKQTIKFFNSPFKIIPASQMPDIVDKYTRNEIMTSNEIRQIMGLKPSSDPEADELRNKNLNKSADQQNSQDGAGNPMAGGGLPMANPGVDAKDLKFQYEEKLKELEEMEKELDEMEKQIGE